MSLEIWLRNGWLVEHQTSPEEAADLLAAAGYRPDRQRAHERAILSLQFTIGLDPVTVATLDGVRRKRNRSNYERAGTASDSEAGEVYQIAVNLKARVLEWLGANHPALLKER
jgi:hypothetical protein